jgi:23S rRNA (pseudouridine1915-N3)-methyltransferase
MVILLLTILALACCCDAWVSSTFTGSRTTSKYLQTTARWTMGMQVKIRIVGRKNGSEKWLEEAYQMYDTRLKPSGVDVETIWHKNDAELIKGVNTDFDKGHSVVLMDPRGKVRSSEQFSEDVYSWLEEGGSRLVFVVGGAPGLPPELKDHPTKNPKLLSLSAMTFTHQFARTILMEQIYRASEIRKGSGYHK